MSGLYKQIYNIVKQVPAGFVTTYGDVAAQTGNPRRSRIVGTAMAACNDNTVPCHRVIRKDGSIDGTFGLGGREYKKFLLENENITFLPDGSVDLSKHLWIY